MAWDQQRYMQTCDAVIRRVAFDIRTCPFAGRVVRDPRAWREWLRGQLDRFGFVNQMKAPGTLAEHATTVAVELLWAGDPGYPEFATPLILTGDLLIDYWRAVTIAAECPR